jgi:hypothetical protein
VIYGTRPQLLKKCPAFLCILSKSVDDILQLKMNNMLDANPEYQRGAVWTPAQKKRLVDSVFRGYRLVSWWGYETHGATHNSSDLHVLRRTYAAARDLQVVVGKG